MNRIKGITFIELLTAATVLAILASIAVPAYRQHLLRVHRTEAMAQLMRIRAAQEKFFLQNNAYSTGSALGALLDSANGRYRFAVEMPDPETDAAASFRAKAIAQGNQTQDAACIELGINDRGARTARPGTTNECWR